MVCEHCQKENRSIAKFCKYCGQPLVSQNVLDRMVGLDEVKKQLKNVVDTYTYLHTRKDVINVRLSVNTIIIGETGTGKTALAEIIRDYFYQYRIIEKPQLTMVDAVDYQRFVEKWDENVQKARGGILFFDNVQKLLPDRYSNQVNPLDKLFVEMDKWDENPIVIMAGLPKGLDDFLAANPAAQNRSNIPSDCPFLVSRNFARSVNWSCVPSMALPPILLKPSIVYSACSNIC